MAQTANAERGLVKEPVAFVLGSISGWHTTLVALESGGPSVLTAQKKFRISAVRGMPTQSILGEGELEL